MIRTRGIVYWAFTGLLCALMITSATRYFLDLQAFGEHFVNFGYNARIVAPLAVAKILAVIAILSNRSILLKEWAYAGLLFDFLLALEAHITLADGLAYGPLIALVLWAVSYFFHRKRYYAKEGKTV